MIINCGIIGLPNVGKSTLFNIITKSSTKVANFPFCTIQPNIGLSYVFDNRVNQLLTIMPKCSVIYSVVKFIDTGGLIQGASKGFGLGNKLLNQVNDVEIFCHVVRCFNDSSIVHISGNFNSNQDVNIINTELILFDIERCEKYIFHLKCKKRASKEFDIDKKLFILERCLLHLYDNKLLYTMSLTLEEKISIKMYSFLSLKPTLYLANVNYINDKYNIFLEQLKTIIPAEYIEIFSNSHNDESTSLCENIKNQISYKIINRIFSILKLKTFFTINSKIIQSWVFFLGLTALEAANKVHSDFKKGFIRVQVIKFDDFLVYKGEKEAKKAGKVHYESKDYQIKNGDILKFLFKI